MLWNVLNKTFIKCLSITPHKKAVAVKCEIETMYKKLTILLKQTEVQASATAFYAQRWWQV
jgi:hypothetical protein